LRGLARHDKAFEYFGAVAQSTAVREVYLACSCLGSPAGAGSLGMTLDACAGSLGMTLDACAGSLGMTLDACASSLAMTKGASPALQGGKMQKKVNGLATDF
jgi:hypothetical protein